MPIVPDHDATLDTTDLIFADQNVRACSSSGESEIDCRIIIARNQVANAPKRNHHLLIFSGSGSDGQRHRISSKTHTLVSSRFGALPKHQPLLKVPSRSNPAVPAKRPGY